MLIDILGAKCVGIEAVPVTVEVDITHGIGIHLVGLADVADIDRSLHSVASNAERSGMMHPDIPMSAARSANGRAPCTSRTEPSNPNSPMIRYLSNPSLAKAMAGILPPMTTEEAIVTSKIYSVAGMKGSQIGLIRTRPFRAPHYSASLPAIIGGGAGADIRPGEGCQRDEAIIEYLYDPSPDRRVWTGSSAFDPECNGSGLLHRSSRMGMDSRRRPT